MAFKIGIGKANFTSDGIPYLWGTGDTTTLPSNEVKITASDGTASDNFGNSVAIGFNRIIVGASYRDLDGGLTNQGGAYLYDLDGSNEQLIASTSSQDKKGESVAIGDGTIAVGAPVFNSFNGKIELYELVEGSNAAPAALYVSGYTPYAPNTFSSYGQACAFGEGLLVVGAPSSSITSSTNGVVFLLDSFSGALQTDRATNGYIEASWLTGAATNTSTFGAAVAVGCGRIVVADDRYSNFTGRVGVYDTDGNELFILDPDSSGERFGFKVAVGQGRIAVGAINEDTANTDAGAFYLYDLNGNLLKKVTNPDSTNAGQFGRVAIGEGRIVSGAPGNGTGKVYIYDLDGNYLTTLTSSDGASSDTYGAEVAIGCGKIVVGAQNDDDNGSSSGSVYVYDTPSVYTLYDAIDLQRGYK